MARAYNGSGVHKAGIGERRECAIFRCPAVIVFDPVFIKEYRELHLANILKSMGAKSPA